jgi:predicted histone-like DNA-binding protein
MPVLYKTYVNQMKNSKMFGKVYARIVSLKTMTYQELCKHMAEHNSVYGSDVCLGVANKLQSCILEQLMEGKKVQFGDLGTFYLSARTNGADTLDDFNISSNVKGIYLRFQPSRVDLNDLSSKTLKKRASFLNVKELAGLKDAEDSNDNE